MSNNKNVLTIQTVQIAPFRTLMTALKDILLETNISFQKDGIRIINMDKSHTTLVHLSLDADKFEHYYCKYPKIVVGVNMMHLFKLINTIDNDDTLTIYIENDDYNDGIVTELGLKFENGDIKQSKLINKWNDNFTGGLEVYIEKNDLKKQDLDFLFSI